MKLAPMVYKDFPLLGQPLSPLSNSIKIYIRRSKPVQFNTVIIVRLVSEAGSPWPFLVGPVHLELSNKFTTLLLPPPPLLLL